LAGRYASLSRLFKHLICNIFYQHELELLQKAGQDKWEASKATSPEKKQKEVISAADKAKETAKEIAAVTKPADDDVDKLAEVVDKVKLNSDASPEDTDTLKEAERSKSSL
jgi:thymidylate synthase